MSKGTEAISMAQVGGLREKARELETGRELVCRVLFLRKDSCCKKTPVEVIVEERRIV
jgi:hypothetical protein